MINKKAFTLLELLVVVLIIGILTSIALPQYRFAVDKAKFARYQTMVKDISSAVMRANLVNDGDWDYTFQELDIEVPGIQEIIPITNPGGEIALFDWGYCYIIKPAENFSDSDIMCAGNDKFGYVHTIGWSSGESTFRPFCVADKDNARGIEACKKIASDSAVTFGPDCFKGPDGEWFCGAKIFEFL